MRFPVADVTDKPVVPIVVNEGRDGAITELEILFKTSKKLTSVRDVETILVKLDDFRKDLSNKSNLDRYSFVLKELIARFDSRFPIDENDGRIYRSVRDLFVIHDKDYLYEAFNVLVKNQSKDKFKSLMVSELLEDVLSSESFIEVILSYVIVKEHFSEEEDYTNLVQILIGLPNRISNELEKDTPQFFSRENYTKLLLVYTIKSIILIGYIAAEPIRVNYSFVSILLGKILIHFNDRYKTKSIVDFIKILVRLCEESAGYQPIIQEVLNKLDRNSGEVFLIMAMQNLTPEVWDLPNLFKRDLIAANNNFNYVVCSKIPLFSYFNPSDTNLMYNLVLILRKHSPEDLLLNLYRNLLSAWSNRSSVEHTSIEHHLYLSKILILTSKALVEVDLTGDCRETLKEKAHAGILVHLQSTSDEVRVVGMKCGEMILNNLSSNVEDAPKLEFDYDNLKGASRLITEGIDKLKYPPDKIAGKGEDLLDLISQLNAIKIEEGDEYTPPERKFRSPRKIAGNDAINEIKYESITPKNNLIKILDSTDFNLDSDDDLEPYDTTNNPDVPSSGKHIPPSYLRDLRDGLLETEDPDVFILSLRHCEEVIRRNLPEDDPGIGLEILEILVTQTPQFYLENYDKIVRDSCVAIVCVYPAYYAPYLCEQIHSDAGKYSISHRLLMMEILSESAKMLSEIKGIAAIAADPRTTETASDIIRKRLELKTKHYFKHKPPLRHEQKNIFAEVAGSFFYPLLHGGQTQIIKNDSDNILLIQLLRTLTVVLNCSQNAPIISKMGKDVFNLSWILKYHREARVRAEVLNLLCTALLVVPKSILFSDFLEELFEIRLWLVDVLSPNIQKGESNSDCRSLAECLMSLIDDVLKVNVED